MQGLDLDFGHFCFHNPPPFSQHKEKTTKHLHSVHLISPLLVSFSRCLFLVVNFDLSRKLNAKIHIHICHADLFLTMNFDLSCRWKMHTPDTLSLGNSDPFWFDWYEPSFLSRSRFSSSYVTKMCLRGWEDVEGFLQRLWKKQHRWGQTRWCFKFPRNLPQI